MQAAKRVGRFLVKAPVDWQGFSFHAPRWRALVLHGMQTGLQTRLVGDQPLGGVVTLDGGVLFCWAKKQNSVALSSWGKRAVRSSHVGQEIFRDLE